MEAFLLEAIFLEAFLLEAFFLEAFFLVGLFLDTPFYNTFQIIKICKFIIIRNIFWGFGAVFKKIRA